MLEHKSENILVFLPCLGNNEIIGTSIHLLLNNEWETLKKSKTLSAEGGCCGQSQCIVCQNRGITIDLSAAKVRKLNSFEEEKLVKEIINCLSGEVQSVCENLVREQLDLPKTLQKNIQELMQKRNRLETMDFKPQRKKQKMMEIEKQIQKKTSQLEKFRDV